MAVFNWEQLSDDDLLRRAGEQPGSQAAYERHVEVERRRFDREGKLAKAQVEAAEAQERAAAATEKSAFWTKWASIVSTIAVVIAAVTLVLGNLPR